MTDQIPPWGCPWHGLVTDGKLELPNGAKIDMRQPYSSDIFQWENGSTSLIDMGVADVDPNAADIDMGKQWFNKAIIAGDQIHGRSIGWDSWIYKAPDGTPWLVKTSLHGTELTAEDTLTITRFGCFGYPEESYTYTFENPEYGRPPYFAQDSALYMRRFDVHPQGSAAIFALVELNDFTRQMGFVGWRELRLSGDPDDLAIESVVLKSYDDCRGVESSTGPIGSLTENSWVAYSVEIIDNRDFDTGTGTVSAERIFSLTDSYSQSSGEGIQLIANKQEVKGITEGSIIGAFYKEDGTISYVTVSTEYAISGSNSGASLDVASNAFYELELIDTEGNYVVLEATQGEYTLSGSGTLFESVSMDVFIDGVFQARHSTSLTTTISSTKTTVTGYPSISGAGGTPPPYTKEPGTIESHTRTISSDGRSQVESSDKFFAVNKRLFASSTVIGTSFEGDYVQEDNTVGYFSVYIEALSNKVYAFKRRTRVSASLALFEFFKAVTPNGLSDADPVELVLRSSGVSLPLKMAAASYDPITRKAIMSDKYVCYT